MTMFNEPSYTISEIMERHNIASRNTVYLWVTKGKLIKHVTPYGVRFTEVEGFKRDVKTVHYINENFRRLSDPDTEWNKAPLGATVKKEVTRKDSNDRPRKVFDDIVRIIEKGKYRKLFVDSKECLEWMGVNLERLKSLARSNDCKIIFLDNWRCL